MPDFHESTEVQVVKVKSHAAFVTGVLNEVMGAPPVPAPPPAPPARRRQPKLVTASPKGKTRTASAQVDKRVIVRLSGKERAKRRQERAVKSA